MEKQPSIFYYNDRIGNYGQGDEYLDAERNSHYKTKCPYCHRSCKTKNDEMLYSGHIGGYDKSFSWCERCGWWSFKLIEEDLNEYADFSSSQAILKEFKLDSEEIPTAALKDYLSKKEEAITKINPKKFEELVGDVFWRLPVVAGQIGDRAEI